MTVHLRGEDITIEAARAQFADEEVVDADTVPDVSVVASADVNELRTANRDAIANDHTAILVELGSIGGRAFSGLDGAIIPVSPTGPCYRCLERRIDASSEEALDDTTIPPTQTRRVLGSLAGYRRVRMARPGDDPGVTVIEFPWRERTLLPVPGCPACDGEGRWTGAEFADGGSRSLDEALEAGEATVDERIGIVSTIGEAASDPLPYYLARLADTTPFSDVAAPVQAAGVADDWNEAFMRALGEALERYAAGTYRADEFRSAVPDSIDGAISPDRFVRPTDATSIDDPIEWLPAVALSDSEHRWVPAELVVFPPPSRQVRPPITTGLALGNSIAEARARGLAEVIERDAAMIAWYSTYEPIGVDVNDDRYDQLVRRVRVEDLSVSTVLLTQDVDVPVIGAAVHRAEAFPKIAVAAAASLDPIEAAIDAVREAIQSWMELATMGEKRAREESPRIAQYAMEPGPVTSFVTPSNSVDAEALGSPDAASSLETLVERATDAGLDPVASTTTTRDLARRGFHATRVLVPRAQPLFTGSSYFGERAERVPRALGFEPRLDRAPHPFP